MELGFRIPNSEIPESTSKIFLDFGIQIPLHGANFSCGLAILRDSCIRLAIGRLTLYGDYCLFDRLFVVVVVVVVFFHTFCYRIKPDHQYAQS